MVLLETFVVQMFVSGLVGLLGPLKIGCIYEMRVIYQNVYTFCSAKTYIPYSVFLHCGLMHKMHYIEMTKYLIFSSM